MRTNLWIAMGLLVIVIAFGIWSSGTMDGLSRRYISASEELLILAQDAQWQRAGEVAAAYRESWDQASGWLQMLIVHEELDAVDMALKRIHAGIWAQDQALCYEACAELRENAEHLSHRDAFTLGNIL